MTTDTLVHCRSELGGFLPDRIGDRAFTEPGPIWSSQSDQYRFRDSTKTGAFSTWFWFI